MLDTFRSNETLRHLSAFFCALAIMTLHMGDLQAKRSPLRKLNGKIVISTESFPRQFKSDRAMLKYMRKHNTHEIKTSGEDPWIFNYMIFLKRNLNQGSAWIVYMEEMAGGNLKYINSYQFYSRDPKQKILSGYASLSQSSFKEDTKYHVFFKRQFKGRDYLAKTILVLRKK